MMRLPWAPNYLHAQMTIDVARAGKHVVCEKPLCLTLEEADEMIEVCRKEGVLLMYAEVRQGERDGRSRSVREGLSGQTERKAFRPARILVFGY